MSSNKGTANVEDAQGRKRLGDCGTETWDRDYLSWRKCGNDSLMACTRFKVNEHRHNLDHEHCSDLVREVRQKTPGPRRVGIEMGARAASE